MTQPWVGGTVAPWVAATNRDVAAADVEAASTPPEWRDADVAIAASHAAGTRIVFAGAGRNG